MKTFGSRSSHLPKMTFCWLPPERLEIKSSGPMHFVRMVVSCFEVAFVIF